MLAMSSGGGSYFNIKDSILYFFNTEKVYLVEYSLSPGFNSLSPHNGNETDWAYIKVINSYSAGLKA